METEINKMCDWERKKAIFLMGEAEKLGMDISGYGELAVNPNSGYTYLWLEDEQVTLYMPINCELVKSDIVAMWTSLEDGEEHEFNLKENTTLEELNKWACELDKEV